MRYKEPAMTGLHPPEPTTKKETLRISTSACSILREEVQVVVESPLTVAVQDAGVLKTLCTPENTTALAVGLVYSEGLIANLDDILEIDRHGYNPEVFTIRLTDSCLLKVKARGILARDVCKTASGLSTRLESLSELPEVKNTFQVHPAWLATTSGIMRSHQALFSQTGATHAAAIITSRGELVAFGEDIGRHNAMDKAIGKCLLDNMPSAGNGLVLSGRVSVELTAKAARAGIELISAVSAPSSLAVKTARQCNITLCGFVREDRATIFTHPQRIHQNLKDEMT